MSAAPEEEDTTLPPDSIVEAEVGLIPESLDADVDSLLRSWHVQYFTKRDDYCHDDEENVYFPDSVYADRLSRLPAMIPLPYNNVVRDCIDLYTERRRGLVRYMLGMADYYFPIIEKILDKHGLPLELKYLAVVESALNPVALSRVGACGLWQFMLPTGKQYGLTINSLVDDRRDPVKATEAACEYFKDMYAIYKDWSLVMASYNCGPGNVNKAIKRSGGKTNFWDIFPYLPRETRSYVPLFIAANYVMNYYCDHNLCPLETDIPLATDTIHVNKILHLQQVADVLHVDIAQLRALNPQYKRDIVPGNTTESVLKLPAAQTYAFIDHEDSIYAYRKAELLPDYMITVSGGSTLPQGGTPARLYDHRQRRLDARRRHPRADHAYRPPERKYLHHSEPLRRHSARHQEVEPPLVEPPAARQTPKALRRQRRRPAECQVGIKSKGNPRNVRETGRLHCP